MEQCGKLKINMTTERRVVCMFNIIFRHHYVINSVSENVSMNTRERVDNEMRRKGCDENRQTKK